MRFMTACLTCVALAGPAVLATGSTYAAPPVRSAEASPERQRTLQPHVKPRLTQPDRKREIRPQIKPGMIGSDCPAGFGRGAVLDIGAVPDKLLATKEDMFRPYSCQFMIKLTCKPGMTPDLQSVKLKKGGVLAGLAYNCRKP